jgi:hypothetical protein
MGWVYLALLASTVGPAAQGPMPVDLTPPMAGPICAHRYPENWNFDPKTAARAFGVITLAFRSKSRLQVRWHKPFLVNGATLTSDGLAADGVLENVDFSAAG